MMLFDAPWCAFADVLLEPLRNGLDRPKAVRGEGVKMINMGELFAHGRIGDIQMDRVLISDAEAQKCLLHPEDLLFARQSLVLSGAGKCSIFTGASEPVTYESHLIRARVNRRVASSAFYYYFFTSRQGRATMETIVEQVAAAGIRGSDLARLKVPCPPLTEQRAIASVLGALDDKIELNRRMNKTLEAISQALFKSWFVDFDPVRAKMEGRAPEGMDAETAALFPSEFEDSELGQIPRGWTVSYIGDSVRVVGGSTPSTAEEKFWNDGEFCWTTPKDLSDLETPILLQSTRKITASALKGISSGLLPIGSVLLSSRAPIGYLAIARVPTAINQGFIGMICDGTLPTEYVYHWVKENMDLVKSRANGTTFMEVSKSNFRPMTVLVPNKSVLHKYETLAATLFQKIEVNVRQNQLLAQTRDAFLPKLISGAVRVSNVIDGGEA